MQLIMSDPNRENFEAFISLLQPQHFYKKAISQQSKFFEITLHQLHKLSPKEASNLREFILSKRRQEQDVREKMREDWVQPEKRLFTWVLLCYLELHHKTVLTLNEQDYQYLSDITTQKSVPLIKYMVHSLLPQEKRPTWTPSQDALLAKLLTQEKKFSTVGEWSSVSRELFLRGDHVSYKCGKNCRERWFNHVNPQLNKEWNLEEDLKLFTFVRNEGKKWSRIIPELHNTKSEHMIKNRFNSQIKRIQTQLNYRTKESDLINLLIQRLTKQKQKYAQQNKIMTASNTAETSNRRILRSDSLRKQNQLRLDQGLLVSKNIQEQIGDNIVEEPFRYFFENIVREEGEKEEKTEKQQFRFNQSMRYHIASPLPPTPVPPTPFSLGNTNRFDTKSFFSNHRFYDQKQF